MEEYEVHCDPQVAGARQFRFGNLSEAKKEAERLCREHHTTASVLLVVGYWAAEPRWISNGVPGKP